MIRKCVAICLVAVILFSIGVIGVKAEEMTWENLDEEARLSEIQKLQDERRALALEFDKNYARIVQIDEELECLGVETLSNMEMVSLVADTTIDPQVVLGSDTYIKWTSYRVEKEKNGIEYEIQVINGVTNKSNSALTNSYSTVEKSINSAVNAATVVLKAVGLYYIAEWKEKAGVILDVLDVVQTLTDALSEVSTHEAVVCEYTGNVVVDVRFAFVKHVNESDNKQILCYIGNAVDYTVDVDIPNAIKVGDTYKSNIISYKDNFTLKSPDYEAVIGRSLTNAYNREVNGTAITPNYYLRKLQFTTINGSKFTWQLPHAVPPLL